MKVGDVGEFGLIERLSEIAGTEYIGDDCAVIRDNGKIILYTSDMLVEGVHFIKERHPPFKLGRKAMCSNISDVAAMGGRPEYALVSIALRPDTDVSFVENLYRGMRDAAEEWGVEIVGGDTVKGKDIVICISLAGTADERSLTLRSGAKEGDFVLISGALGGSLAGLRALENGIDAPDAVERHLDPGCRADISEKIGNIANSMIDISDGLASEIGHISEMSMVGAKIYADRIPVHPSVYPVADALSLDPVEMALSGGEEYELLFTVAEEHLKEAEKYGTPIGRMGGEGVRLIKDGKEMKIGKGWVQF